MKIQDDFMLGPPSALFQPGRRTEGGLGSNKNGDQPWICDRSFQDAGELPKFLRKCVWERFGQNEPSYFSQISLTSAFQVCEVGLRV